MTSSAARVLVDLTHRDALEGIEAYAASQGGWEILLRPGFLELDAFLAEIGNVDGILTSSHSRALRDFAGHSIPVVAIGGSGPIEGVPHVRCDDRAVGRMAAEYFLEKGFTDLAFVYEVRAPFALARGEGFVQEASQAGASVTTDLENTSRSLRFASLRRGLAEWISSLPKPVGVFASAMSGAIHVAQTCLRLGLSVPDDVAILGLGRDILRARLCTPSLSTLDQNDLGCGYHGARLLHRMMQGQSVAAEPVPIEPVGVTQRESTDVLAVKDPTLRAALALIRQRANEPIGVEDILETLPISRRALERAMREAIGRTPMEEINRVRLSNACRMLRQSDQTVERIARQVGLGRPARLNELLKRSKGLTCSAYRRKFRSGRDFSA
jgi:LacI family transcriptional regulator